VTRDRGARLEDVLKVPSALEDVLKGHFSWHVLSLRTGSDPDREISVRERGDSAARCARKRTAE
jgi:hypothetical protein